MIAYGTYMELLYNKELDKFSSFKNLKLRQKKSLLLYIIG